MERGYRRLFDAQLLRRTLQTALANQEPAAGRHHVFDFIECLKQPHFYRAILFSFIQRSSMPESPTTQRILLEEDTYREDSLAIRGYVENVFAGRASGASASAARLPTK